MARSHALVGSEKHVIAPLSSEMTVAGQCDQHLYGRCVACMSVYGGSLERQCVASGRTDKMYYSNNGVQVPDTRGPFHSSRERSPQSS